MSAMPSSGRPGSWREFTDSPLTPYSRATRPLTRRDKNRDFRARFPMVGRDGVTWDEVMDPEPEAYLGCMMDKMPNCWLYLGPNGAPGAGNAYLAIELECALIIRTAKKMLREKIKSVCVK